MAVFITGGYGHVGSWITYLLAKEGERVIICDTNPVPPVFLSEVSSQITFFSGDVMDFPRMAGFFQEHGKEIDGIIHTVAIMAENVLTNPHKNVMLNIGGHLNMLEIARMFDIKKVLFTSTGAVYGAAQGKVSEDSHLPNPSDLYGATKSSCEYLGMQYENAFGIDFRIGRIFFVYGPGRKPSEFINLYRVTFGALEGLEGLHFDKGREQILDFTYVEDTAQGLALLYKADNLKNKVFNIATGVGHSVGEAVELVQKYTHFPVEVSIGPGKLMPRCEALDITRAQAELGYQPKYGLEEGIKRYAEWLGSIK